MKFFDLHQDLMSHIRFREQFEQSVQTDFDLLERNNIDTVIATAFPLPPHDDFLSSVTNELIEEELRMYRAAIAMRQNWQIVTEAKDLEAPCHKLIMHVEGLNVFDDTSDSWARLDRWRALGLRSVAPHWNINNSLGGGTCDPVKPLSALGRAVLHYAEQNALLLDFAHMGRQTFADAAALVTRPIYVSHGNADALCPDLRNYNDEQLKRIAETDGVIGVFAPNTFVVGKGRLGNLTDLVSHIRYISDLIGVRHVAIGTDFGGIITGTIQGFSSLDDIDGLQQSLRSSGFDETEIHNICYANARRIAESHLQ